MGLAVAHHGAVQAATSATSWPSLLVSALAVGIAVIALWSNFSLRRRDALASLLRRYEEGHFHVRMWRMEQLTRGEGNDLWAIERRTIREVEAALDSYPERRASLDRALGRDWSMERVDMQGMYFFALQLRQWLPSKAVGAKGRARLLNKTFGYQLLSSLLDQRIAACRLLPDEGRRGIPAKSRKSYYPTHYGLFDPRYNELVDWLAEDLLGRGELPGRVEQVLTKKRAAIDKLLATLEPQPATVDD